jgi:prepilin-type N-terminal cleavage/methylation domain-containing protein
MKKTKKIINKLKKIKAVLKGFTLIELLVVIAIIGLLSSIVLVALNSTREKAKETAAVSNIKQLQIALELYYNDMGFYPPDVVRGWDPGISKALPYNLTDPNQDCAINQGSCVCNNYLSCTSGTIPPGLPNDWIAQVQSHWKGPYIVKWPTNTPWGGFYDYNYWNVDTDRGACGAESDHMVPKGIYLGIENTTMGTPIDPQTELNLYNQGIDNDGCPNNGEVQLLLLKL